MLFLLSARDARHWPTRCHVVVHKKDYGKRKTSSRTDPGRGQEQKKPTWRNTPRRSTTSAYSSTSPPVQPGCSPSSHPTTIFAEPQSIATRFWHCYNGRPPSEKRNRELFLPAVFLQSESLLAVAAVRQREGFAQASTHPFDRNGPSCHRSHGPGGHRRQVLSLHHDISTVAGEERVLLTLVAASDFRESRKRSSYWGCHVDPRWLMRTAFSFGSKGEPRCLA
jgi:hypothetical protein